MIVISIINVFFIFFIFVLHMNNSLLNTLLLVITLLLVAFNTFGSSGSITKALESVEAMKVGWVENYEIVKKIYQSDTFKSQQKQSLEAAQKQMAWDTADTTDTANQADTTDTTKPADTTDTATAPSAKTLTDDQIAAIKKMWFRDGAKDGSILLLEYSDIQCPFCKRHHDNGTIASLLKKYDGKIAHSFRNFPLSFHEFADAWANATYCAADQWGSETFYKFLDLAFTKGLTAEQVLFDVAKELKLDEAKFKTCMETKPHASIVAAEMSEGQSLFGVTGTPGNVMINTKTKERIAVAGAYPASEFEKTLDLWTK